MQNEVNNKYLKINLHIFKMSLSKEKNIIYVKVFKFLKINFFFIHFTSFLHIIFNIYIDIRKKTYVGSCITFLSVLIEQ